MTPARKLAYYGLSLVEVATGLQPPVHALASLSGRMTIDEVRVRATGTRFAVRSAMDVWTVKETWIDRVYERFGSELRDGWTVFDIGAGFGDFSLRAASAGPGVRVHAFEPHPGSRALLEDNLARNAETRISVHPEAVAARSGTVSLLAADEALDSAVSVDPAGDVPAWSLADALGHTGTARCDLIKLDCEGSEFGILEGADEATLARVDRIVMEYHDDADDGRDHRALGALLAARGYRVQARRNPVHDHIGYLSAVRPGV